MLEVRCALDACDDSGPAVVACVCTSTYVCVAPVCACVSRPSVLVAPIHTEGGVERSVLLPTDSASALPGLPCGGNTTWVHVWTGQRYCGGSTPTVAAPTYQPPVFVQASCCVDTRSQSHAHARTHAHMFTGHSRASAEWARRVRVCVLTCVCLGWQRLSLDGFELLAALRVRGLIDWGPFPLNSTDWNDGSHY